MLWERVSKLKLHSSINKTIMQVLMLASNNNNNLPQIMQISAFNNLNNQPRLMQISAFNNLNNLPNLVSNLVFKCSRHNHKLQ
jgi:hypothetical protein